MMRAKTIGPYIWGARSGGDGTTFNGRDRQAHDRTVQAARCQLFKRHQRTLCDPVASSERGHVRARPRLRPLHKPANALQKGADALAKIIRFRFFSWAGSWGLAILAHRA